MPPKKSAAKAKRPLEEASDNARQPAAKRATKKAQAQAQAEEPGESSQAAATAQTSTGQTTEGIRTRRVRKGPKGETFLPQVMPQECAKALDKIPLPGRWLAGIDGIPGREMTLGNRRWWEAHGPWLEQHKTQLKLSATNWKKRDEALKKDASVPEDEGNDDWDFVCRHRPNGERKIYGDDDDDDEDEEDESEDEEEDESEEGDEEEGDGGDKPPKKSSDPHMKFASLHPEWPWVSTVLGLEREQWWTQETLKRDQDDFDMHIYNDFSNYGMLEVLENILQRFTDVCKPKSSYREVWPEVEGLAYFLRSDLISFGMCDDPDRCKAIVEMVGYLTVVTINVLEKQGVFKADSEVRNIGIVLAMLIRWAWDQHTEIEFEEEHISWIYKVIDLAEEAQIDLAVPSTYSEKLNEIKADKADKAKDMKRWDSVNWSTKIKSYISHHGGMEGPRSRPKLGGDHYDITKMSARERKQYSLGGGGGFLF